MFEKDANGDVVIKLYPFPSKTAGQYKLFQRLHGKVQPVVVGVNTIDFVIPYDLVKIDGMDITNALVGEVSDMIVLDTPLGLVQMSAGVPAESIVPNAPLNQFGFGVGMPDGKYEYASRYEADMYKDMVIRIVYTATVARNLVFNFHLHECKV